MASTSRSAGRTWSLPFLMVLFTASLILSISMGVRQSLGLFLDPLVQATGFSVATFGLTLAIQNLAWGIGQPIMGALADRFGGRMVVIGGAFAFAAGLWLMSSGALLGLYLGGGLLIGFAVAATSHGVLVGILSRLAAPNIRAVAVSILAAVGSLGTVLIAPGSQALLDLIDWRTTLWLLAGLTLFLVLFSFFLNAPTQNADQNQVEQPNALAATRMAFKSRGFVVTTIAFFACGFQLIFIATHLPKFVAICGLPPSVSANAIAIIGIANAFGTLAAGRLGEKYGNRLVLAGIYLLRTASISIYLLLPISAESTLVFAAAMGFLWLSVIPPVSGLLNIMFGPANFGILFGIMFLSHQVGAFLGAYLGGLSYDLSGSYGIAWASLIIVGCIAALIQLSMNEPVQSLKTQTAAP